ncbi:F510_1955 family glycosylhydrolase [Cytobacillus sp. FJAT-54145]|uniref:F510_1955 family glycosylhydrolase n=1 Tax=Cytobacillus spartinae TaxID=3299023 RepID=A0ABW6KJM0_9BACI
MKKSLTIALLGLILALTACGQEEDTLEQETAEKPKTEENQQETEENNAEKNAQSEKETTSIVKNEFFEPFKGTIEHVHGLGYVGNQGVAFFASHDGLKLFDGNEWYKTKKENNDYMGFNATANGFYSSGHPGADSSLPNPIGIQKSYDFGKSLESIALEGEVDFHLMGVGYDNNVIFVKSPHKSSIMEENKFYISEDEGSSWREVPAKGLNGEIISLAVHPNDENLMAAAGKEGIFLSSNKGEEFRLLTNGAHGTSIFFTKGSLIYGAYNEEPMLIKRSLTDQSEKEIKLPELNQDAVLYFAVNPQNEKEMIFISFNGDIYLTVDGATSWQLIADDGNLK